MGFGRRPFSRVHSAGLVSIFGRTEMSTTDNTTPLCARFSPSNGARRFARTPDCSRFRPQSKPERMTLARAEPRNRPCCFLPQAAATIIQSGDARPDALTGLLTATPILPPSLPTGGWTPGGDTSSMKLRCAAKLQFLFQDAGRHAPVKPQLWVAITN